MTRAQLYDTIGAGYAGARRADPQVFAQVLDALGDAETIINVGAGTGNYEPIDRAVVAVEPNGTMIQQRTSSGPIVCAFAESLPFADDSFDAALAMFTIHHWRDRDAGLREIGRVARRQVALVYDATVTTSFWLLDYFDEVRDHEPDPEHPSPGWIADHLPLVETRALLIPAACTDGFAGAYWNRPERYLDPKVQAGMSILARLPAEARAVGTERLRHALDSGVWEARYGHLRDLHTYDIGYRLAICDHDPST